MTPEQLPICKLKGDAPLEELIAVELAADFYTLDELRTIVRVLEKYKALCQLVTAPTVGGLQ